MISMLKDSNFIRNSCTRMKKKVLINSFLALFVSLCGKNKLLLQMF